MSQRPRSTLESATGHGLASPDRATLPLALRPTVIALLVVLGWLSIPASSQTAAPPEPSPALDAVLARVTFDGDATPAELGPALADLEAHDLAALCNLLVEPGGGDDTKPRMALQGLTWYVGSAGTAAQRTKYTQALCAALETDRPAPVKAFLIRQLQMVGDRRAVPSLAPFLSDEDLYDFAAQALLTIGGDKAAAAFRTAYPESAGRRRVAMIDALGLLRDRESKALLEEDLFSRDKDIQWAAVVASANTVDHPELHNGNAQDPIGSWYERSRVYATALQACERLVEDGNADDAEAILALAFDPQAGITDAHLRCAYLYALARIRGAAATGEIVAAMADDNVELRAAAEYLAVALSGDGATDALIAELGRAAAAGRAGILNILGQRGDPAALPAATDALQDENRDVRVAAVSAVATLGQQEALDPLLAYLREQNNDEEREAAQRALTRIRGAHVSEHLGAAMEDAPPGVRTALIEVLADRRARDQLQTIYRAARHADEAVRLAAIRAVELLADEQAAPELLRLLAGAQGDHERSAIEDALAATSNRADSPAQRAAPILAALQPQDERNYASLLRVLGHIGGGKALDAVRTALQDEREEVCEAAFRALLAWPDPAAARDVLDIARSTDDLKYHVLALRAYARLVSLDESCTPEHLLAMCDDGMRVARRPEERKLLLAKMGTVHDARTLSMLERHLDDEALAAEAAAAMVSVAEGLLPAGWQTARTALDRALAATEVESVRRRAADALKRVNECEGFITDWRVAGPFTRPKMSGQQLLDIPFPPEQPGADVKWLASPVAEEPEQYWLVDLQAHPSIRGDNRAAYLATRICAPHSQAARLEVGSDDGIKIWLNGAVVHRNNALRGCARGADTVAVILRAGWNDLLVKVTNNGGGWAASVRVRAPDGDRLEGLRVEAERQP